MKRRFRFVHKNHPKNMILTYRFNFLNCFYVLTTFGHLRQLNSVGNQRTNIFDMILLFSLATTRAVHCILDF